MEGLVADAQPGDRFVFHCKFSPMHPTFTFCLAEIIYPQFLGMVTK